MTLFITTCFAVAAIRFIEAFVRYMITFFSRPKKKEEVVAQEWKRLSACVSPQLHGMIKAHAQLMGLTITDYILLAINEKLEREARG